MGGLQIAILVEMLATLSPICKDSFSNRYTYSVYFNVFFFFLPLSKGIKHKRKAFAFKGADFERSSAK